MKIILKDTGHEWLDGEHVLDPPPSTRETVRFRKELGMSPSEMTDALSGSIEVIPFYLYTVFQRDDRGEDALRVLDLPISVWGNAKRVDSSDDEAEEATLPPPSGLASNGSGPEDEQPGGMKSPEHSEMSA